MIFRTRHVICLADEATVSIQVSILASTIWIRHRVGIWEVIFALGIRWVVMLKLSMPTLSIVVNANGISVNSDLVPTKSSIAVANVDPLTYTIPVNQICALECFVLANVTTEWEGNIISCHFIQILCLHKLWSSGSWGWLRSRGGLGGRHSGRLYRRCGSRLFGCLGSSCWHDGQKKGC